MLKFDIFHLRKIEELFPGNGGIIKVVNFNKDTTSNR